MKYKVKTFKRKSFDRSKLPISMSPAPKCWKKIPEILAQKPGFQHVTDGIFLSRWKGTRLCCWVRAKDGFWWERSDIFEVQINR